MQQLELFQQQTNLRKPAAKDCWQTPANILELVRETFGGQIDTDPCTTEENPTGASLIYTPENDGLATGNLWTGKVFVNPPYSNPAPWLERIFKDKLETIALIPVGALGAKRSATACQSASALCLWTGRIAFINPVTGKECKGTSFTSAFLYWGTNKEAFGKVFKPYGMVSYT